MNRRLLASALAFALTATGAVVVAQPAVAASPVLWLDGRFQDLVIDDAHRQAFVSQQNPDAVLVVDFGGKVTRTLTGFTKPKDLSLSPDGSTVYVAEHDTPSLGVIRTDTFAVDKVGLPAGHCLWSTASTGGKLWYSYRDCASGTGSIGSYDPATGETTGGTVANQAGELRAFPNRPDRLFQQDRQNPDGAMHVYDVTTGTPVQVSASAPGHSTGCSDIALFAGGDKVAVACPGLQSTYTVFNTADFSVETPIAGDAYVKAIAVSPDDRFVATGTTSAPGIPSALSVWDVQSGSFITRRPNHECCSQLARSLAFTADDKLFSAFVNIHEDADALQIIDAATTSDTAITLDAPETAGGMATVRFSGTLHYGPGAGTVLSVQRKDFAGTHRLADVTVDARGNFAFVDALGRTGRADYVVSFAGDGGHRPATVTKTVDYRGLPGDINGDGYVDTVVGVPGEDLGDDVDTGQFHLLYGSATGVTTAANKAVHQDTEGIGGSNEDGDRLGHATAFGDFNADGYSDLAVSAPGEDSGSTADVGMVLLLYGSPSGLDPFWSTVSAPNEPVANMAFGTSLAVGDFNGDGRDDLAVGAPGAGEGAVFAFAGGEVSRLDHDWYGMPGSGYEGERFGQALDAGDVNGDGFDDLAVSEPGDVEDRGFATGAVTLLKGKAIYGLGTTGAQRLTKNTPGVPGSPGTFNTSKGDSSDQFGAQVVLADFNGDGRDDLAVGAPGAPVTGTDGARKADAGTVTVLYSDGTQIGTAGAVEVTQKTAGMPGNPGAEDGFGAALAAGDADRDGREELAVYGSGEDFITVVPGGLAYAGAKAWDQDSPGIPGGSETSDRWGAELRFADTKGDGYLSLLVGATGEDSGAGALTVLYSNSAGTTGTGAKFFSQDTTGIPGGEEKNDAFGALL